MNNTEGTIKSSKMETTIKGHKVTLHFADEPNPDVAVQVKLFSALVCWRQIAGRRIKVQILLNFSSYLDCNVR